MSARFISTFCCVLALSINVREAVSSDETDSPVDESEYTTSDFRCELNEIEHSLPFCCPLGSFMVLPGMYECTPMENRSVPALPRAYNSTTVEGEDYKIHFVYSPDCWGAPGVTKLYKLEPELNAVDEFKLTNNGSIYFPFTGSTVEYGDYCLGAVDGSTVFAVVMSVPEDIFHSNLGTMNDALMDVATVIAKIISILFLLVTFAVYSVIPELRNIHGATMRGYVGALSVSYTAMTVDELTPDGEISHTACTLIAYVNYFFTLASVFWLSCVCFDIWRTLGDFKSLHGGGKRWELKRFIVYSAYAWGGPTLLTAICLIVDYAPSVSRKFVRPDLGVRGCWFWNTAAYDLYFRLPSSLVVTFNLYFFVSTIIKIIRHKLKTGHRFKGTNSQRHDDHNKQRFNIYLKLFILMATNWSMDMIGALFDAKPKYLWHTIDVINNLQGVIIFVIFVWKDNIKRLVLKRLRRQDRSGTSSATAMTYRRKMGISYSESVKSVTIDSDCVDSLMTN